jgi:hypothetical protein
MNTATGADASKNSGAGLDPNRPNSDELVADTPARGEPVAGEMDAGIRVVPPADPPTVSPAVGGILLRMLLEHQRHHNQPQRPGE